MQQDLFEKADLRVKEIAESVKSGKKDFFEKYSWLRTRIYPGLWYKLGYWAIPEYDNKFWVTDKCSGCKICREVCPVSNISIGEDLKPIWHNNCEQCMACIQWCPDVAIEIGSKSKEVPRYQNPNVRVKDIINQKKGGKNC
jgi:NAD-dependent dihydropyrimidine dehydrogenase PreA subunit